MTYDAAVVGGGILGLATARELLERAPGSRVVVLEREHDIARHQTSHNSGVVHAGIYYAPGSLKARLAVEGAAATRDYCTAHGLPFAERGKLIVATDPAELPRLDELERRGRANGVVGLVRLDGDGLRQIEPAARGIAALYSPLTAVTDFGAIARAIAAEVVAAGGEVRTGVAVQRIGCRNTAHRGQTAPDSPGGVVVEHRGGVIEAGRVVACAGLWADRLAVASGAPRDPVIVPFRGAYRDVGPEIGRAHV